LSLRDRLNALRRAWLALHGLGQEGLAAALLGYAETTIDLIEVVGAAEGHEVADIYRMEAERTLGDLRTMAALDSVSDKYKQTVALLQRRYAAVKIH